MSMSYSNEVSESSQAIVSDKNYKEYLSNVGADFFGSTVYKYSDLVFESGKSTEQLDAFREFALSPSGTNGRFDNIKLTGVKSLGNNNTVQFIDNQVRFTIYRFFDIFMSVNAITDSQNIKHIGLYNKDTNEKFKDIVFNSDIVILLSSKRYQNIPYEIRVEYTDANHVPECVEMTYSGAFVCKEARQNLEY
jgi:hypothetical protein